MADMTRRTFIRWATALGVSTTSGSLLAACGGTVTTGTSSAAAAATSSAVVATTAVSSAVPATTAVSSAAPATTLATSTAVSSVQTTAVSAAPVASQANTTGAKVTLRYTFDNTPGEATWHKKVNDDYAKLHPEVTLQAEQATGDWVTKTVAQLVSGTGPDIVLGFGATFFQLAATGAFDDLSAPIKQWGANYDLADIYPEALKELQIGGKQYSIPYCFDPVSVFFYLKPVLHDANIPFPNDTWTYDDFQKDLIALTKQDASGKTVQWGYNGAESIAGWGYVRTYPAIWAYGGDKYNADMTHCMLADPEALKVLDMYYNLKVKDKTSPTAADSGKLNYYQMFANGQCAMQTTGPWAIGTYQNTVKGAILKDNWDVGPPPSGPKGRFILAAGNDWGLNKNGKNKAAALTLLQYLTDKDRSKEVGSIARRVPARLSAGNAFVQPNTTPTNQTVFPQSLSYARVERLHPTQEAKIAEILTTAWNQIIVLNKAAPGQIMPEAVSRVDALLKQG
jgi:multiple sugar transport system substrate-binding protein